MKALRRVVTALLCIVVVLGAAAAPASAHAQLVSTNPADGAHVEPAPKRVSLRFSEHVSLKLGGVRVLNTDGERVDKDDAKAVNDTVTVGLRDGLGDGSYVVAWNVISADSHPVNGAFTFVVGAGAERDRRTGRVVACPAERQGMACRRGCRPLPQLRGPVARRRRDRVPDGGRPSTALEGGRGAHRRRGRDRASSGCSCRSPCRRRSPPRRGGTRSCLRVDGSTCSRTPASDGAPSSGSSARRSSPRPCGPPGLRGSASPVPRSRSCRSRSPAIPEARTPSGC